MEMIKETLALSMLSIGFAAHGACVHDSLEVGDSGPSSELVCGELAERFPGAALAGEGRSIHSSSEVSVTASVDGAPVLLRYRLKGYSWQFDEPDVVARESPPPRADLSMSR
jgi:hypothetical protein